MTPPVLLDAPTGAASVLAVGDAAASPPSDPALAAEFAAMLGAALPNIGASPAVVPSGPSIDALSINALSIETAVPAVEATANPVVATMTDLRSTATTLGEGDREATGSVAPVTILDSAETVEGTSDATRLKARRPSDAETMLGTLPAVLPLPSSAVGGPAADAKAEAAKTKGSVICATASTRHRLLGPEDGGEGGGVPSNLVPNSKGESSEMTLTDGLLADVTAISGGGARSDDAATGDGDRRESTPDPTGVLVADRPATSELRRGEGIEARPLDRGERTRIVHEVIDKVSKHVETLAISRSKEPLTIRLEPADLGRIVVEVSREVGGLTAEMSASDPRVAEALDRHRGELVAGLAARGHTEARVTVQTATNAENPAFDLRRDPGQSGQQGANHQHQHQQTHGTFRGDSSVRLTTAVQRSRPRLRVAGLDLEI